MGNPPPFFWLMDPEAPEKLQISTSNSHRRTLVLV